MGLLDKFTNNNNNNNNNPTGGNAQTGYDPQYDNAGYNDPNAGYNNGTNRETGEHQGRFKNTAEGAGVGGVAGHEWEKHHGGTGPGAGTGAAAGGLVGNEYNRHHAGAGAGAGGPDYYNDGNGMDNGNGTDRATGEHQGRFKNTAEGAGVGGVAGHEWEKHHGGTGPGAGTGAAAGGFVGNEYNRHHAGAGATAGGQGAYDDTTVGYDRNGTDRATGEHQGRFKNTAEGAAAGGVAGHEWEKHRGGGGPGAGTGVAAGGLAGNEYNRHHAGAGAGRGPAVASNQPATAPGMGADTAGLGTAGGPHSAGANQPAAVPTQREARHLERTGKIEKAIGSVICSTSLQERGLEKQAQASNISGQHQNLSEAQRLEAEAKLRRGQAVGLGAHPDHALPPGQNGGIAAQGAGVGGGAAVGGNAGNNVY